jgi:hypothetical protein
MAALTLLADAPKEPGTSAEKEKEEERPPRELRVGAEGLFRPSLLLQSWYVLDRFAPSGCVADECVTTTSTFRVRRAELIAAGAIIPRLLEYKFSFDVARLLEFKDVAVAVANQSPPPSDPAHPETVTVPEPTRFSSVLQDVFLTVSFSIAEITAGQFRIPVSYEGSRSSSQTLFPERAVVSRFYGDRRDMGVRVAKNFTAFSYVLALMNGSGQNLLDDNNAKDASIRLEAYPIEGMTLAAVAYSTIGLRAAPGAKDRWEADFRFARGPVLVLSEFIRGRDRTAGGVVDSYGFYVAGGYAFFDGKLQPIARVGHLDPHMGVHPDPAVALDQVEDTTLEAGLNYYLLGNEAKLQLALGWFLPPQPKPVEFQTIGAFQYSY